MWRSPLTRILNFIVSSPSRWSTWTDSSHVFFKFSTAVTMASPAEIEQKDILLVAVQDFLDYKMHFCQFIGYIHLNVHYTDIQMTVAHIWSAMYNMSDTIYYIHQSKMTTLVPQLNTLYWLLGNSLHALTQIWSCLVSSRWASTSVSCSNNSNTKCRYFGSM